ncbi:MAG: glycosyltransferase family 2 protein [Rhizobiaceae bacterium]
MTPSREEVVGLPVAPSHAASYLFLPELADWGGILSQAGLGRDRIVDAALRARINGVSIQREALSSGVVSEGALYSAIAADLGLEFRDTILPEDLVASDRDVLAMLRRREGPLTAVLRGTHSTRVLLDTDRLDVATARRRVRQSSELRQRWLVTTPSAARRALWARAAPMLARIGVFGLLNRRPELSARVVMDGRQGFAAGLAIGALGLAAVVAPLMTASLLHAVTSLFFLGCVLLRLMAAIAFLPLRRFAPRPFDVSEMPVYTVLVALYREAEIVPELLVALGRLQWPRGKLDVKLVCEQDDVATIAAIRANSPRPWVEIVEVPPIGPRTKPKALSYALPAARGEFVALYDAEDKPHPLQLIEAWQTFRGSDSALACLQAPLEISNGAAALLPRMFAFEYAALFRGLLPWLGRAGVVLPLGGTSNHFRRSALEAVGGWDPFNVTEDADLGARLYRFGYHTGTISSPTYEQAPEDINTWIPQRTRWFKGWAQTWLVHMRRPLRLLREIGPASFMLIQLLFAGMVLSAAAHPLMIAAAIYLALSVALGVEFPPGASWLFVVDVMNVTLGYVSFLVLGWVTLSKPERLGFWKIVVATPFYWLFMSLAAWRALHQLRSKPHVWEKTPHRPTLSF